MANSKGKEKKSKVDAIASVAVVIVEEKKKTPKRPAAKKVEELDRKKNTKTDKK